jgi:nucleoside-diphosphate kinase
MESSTERLPLNQFTVALIKSKSMHNADAIIATTKGKLDVVVRTTYHCMHDSMAHAFYAEHKGRPYYAGLIGSVTGIEGTEAIFFRRSATYETDKPAWQIWRELMGPSSDPALCPKDTIRGRYGLGKPDNAVHGSDSVEAVAKEMSVVFPTMWYWVEARNAGKTNPPAASSNGGNTA